MSNYRRVTVTVPAAILEAGDRLAARLDRSRSWVVAEALRRMAAEPGAARRMRAATDDLASATAAVGGPSTPPYESNELRSAFRAAEASRFEGDLAMTPEQRVHVSEEIARTRPSDRPRPRYRQVLQFDTYADFLDWKRYRSLEP